MQKSTYPWRNLLEKWKETLPAKTHLKNLKLLRALHITPPHQKTNQGDPEVSLDSTTETKIGDPSLKSQEKIEAMEIEVEDIDWTDQTAEANVIPRTGGTEITIRAEASEEQKGLEEDMKEVMVDQEAATQEEEQRKVLLKR